MVTTNDSQPKQRTELDPFARSYLHNPVFVNVVNTTVKKAQSAYDMAKILSVVLFVVGIILIIISVVFGIFRETTFTYFFGGLGVTSIVSLFLYRPVEKIQSGIDSLIKSQIACLSFMAQYDILMRPLAESPNTSYENRWKISEQLKALTSQLIVDLEIRSVGSSEVKDKKSQK
jgi:hypothetical protein